MNHFRAKVLTNFLTLAAGLLVLSRIARPKSLARQHKAREIGVKTPLQQEKSARDSSQ